MATFHWQVGSGDWKTAGNWNPSGPPTSTDDAVIDALGTYTVTTSQNESINNLTLVSTATLSVGDNTQFTVDGATISNAGTIALNSAGNSTQLIIGSSSVSLSGKGAVTLSDHSNNLIYGALATDTLTNVDNTISGAGQLGDAALTLINQSAGIINGSAATNALVVNTGGSGSFSNAGTTEATGAGGLNIASSPTTNTGTIEALTNSTLTIQNSTITNTSGLIEAVGSKAFVDLSTATINNGTVATSSGGTIQTTSGNSTIDKATINNASNLVVGDNTQLTLGSPVNNTGTVSLASAGNTVQLIIDANGVSLSGKGAVTLNDHSNDIIVGAVAADVLTNVDNTISGGGKLGDGALTLVNQAAGVINGGATNNALTLDAGSGSFSNAGTIKSTGGKGLVILNSTGTNTGTVEAVGSSATLSVQNSTITGGIFATSGGGTIQSGNSTIDKATINNASNLVVLDNNSLTLGATVNNTGTVSLNSAGNTTQLIADANGVTLQSKGTVALTDHSNNFIYGAVAADVLTNVDNTISGAGGLGDGQLTLVNQSAGIINGSGTNFALSINTGGSGSFSNAGTVEATGAGGLSIVNSPTTNTSTIEALTNSTLTINNSTITNTSGIVEAVGSKAFVDLSSATINNGTVATSSGGTIQTTSANSTIDNATINNANNLVVGDNTELTLGSTVNNTGTVSLASVGNTVQLIIDANGVSLSGKGAVTLNDHSNDLVFGAAASDVLTNVDNTISGGGQLGDGALTLVNQAAGIINGGATNNALTLDTGASGSFSNAGTIESTGGKGLVILNSTGTNTGTIEAVGSSATLSVQNSTITGGIFATSGGGTIQSGNSTIDKATINNASNLVVLDNNSLTLGSTVNNTGTVSLASVGNTVELIIDANGVSLSGKGAVTLTDQSNNLIFGAVAADVLTNVDNTISGSGQLGDGGLTLVNQSAGIINGSGTSHALTLNTGGSGSFSNAGTIEATGAGGLAILNSTGTNTGTIESLTNSTLTIQNSTVTNTSGNINAAGSGAVVALSSATINNGTLATSGGGTIKTTGGNSTIDKATINNANNLVVGDNTDLTLGSTVNNTGTLSLASAGNTVELIIDANGVSLSGKGAVTLNDHSNNLVFGAAASDVLTNVDNTISGGGQLGDGQMTLVNQAAGIINGSGTNNALTLNTGGSGSFSNAGLIESTGAGGLKILNGTGTNTGTIEGLTNSTLAIQNSTITNTKGTIQAVGAGAFVALSSATINGGTLSTSAGGTIKTTGGNSTIDKATINNASSLVVGDNTDLTLGSTVNGAGTLSLASAGNTVELIIDANGATLQGKGTVTLNDHGNDLVFGTAASDVLTNVSDTISGGGQLGDGLLTLVNLAAGKINATGKANALTLNTGSGSFSNAGLIESTGSAGLNILNSTGTNTGTIEGLTKSTLTITNSTIANGKGTILATGTSAVVVLGNGTAITGGTLATSKGGTIKTAGGSNSTVDNATINNASTFTVSDNSNLHLGSTVNNTGTFSLASAGNTVELIIDSSGAAFTGGGAVVLNDHSNDLVFGAAAANVLTNVDNTISGGGQLGDIQMTLNNEAAGIIDANAKTNTLTVNLGSGSLFNAGTLEADGKTLTVQTSFAIGGTGTAMAADGGTVNLNTQSFVGNYAFSQSGRINDGTSYVLGVAIPGTVYGFAGGDVLDFQNLKPTGGLSEFWTQNGANTGTLTVQQTVSSTTTTVATINFAGVHTTSDFGISLDGGGGLIVSGVPALTTDSWTNGLGGDWGTAGNWSGGVPGQFSNVLINAKGSYKVTDSQATTLIHSLGTNAGTTLDIAASTSFTDEAGTATSTNSGAITVETGATFSTLGMFNQGTTGLISAVASGATIDLAEGTIKGGKINIVAGALMEATQGSGPTVLAGVTVTDAGTLEAIDATVLTLANDMISGTGTVQAGSASSTGAIVLDGTTINTGTVLAVASGGGTISTAEFSTSTLNGATIAAGTTVTVADNSTLMLKGTVTDNGTIAVTSTGDPTTLGIGATTTLKGSGSVTLAGSSILAIGATKSFTLTNSETIAGTGSIGNGDLTLKLANGVGATINANGTSALTINTGNAVTNSGTMEATGTGGLTIDDAVTNSATVAANGGKVTIVGSLTGKGTAKIFSGNQMELKATSNSAPISFQDNSGDTGTLVLDHAVGFTGTIAGFFMDNANNSDTVDLQDISVSTVSWAFKENSGGTGGTLSITDGTHKASIALMGHYLAANGTASSGGLNSGLFGTATDGSGGTLLTTTHQAP